MRPDLVKRDARDLGAIKLGTQFEKLRCFKKYRSCKCKFNVFFDSIELGIYSVIKKILPEERYNPTSSFFPDQRIQLLLVHISYLTDVIRL